MSEFNWWPRFVARLLSVLVIRRTVTTLLVFVAGAASATGQAPKWPTTPVPPNAQHFEVGQQLQVNGVPMQVRGFLVAKGPAELTEWYRLAMGQPLIQSQLGKKLILGRAQGDFYITIQIEAADDSRNASMSKAIVAVTNTRYAVSEFRRTRELTQTWTDRLPSGTQVVNQMSSEEAGKLSFHLVATNAHSEQVNADRIKRYLGDIGYRLERQSTATTETLPSLPQGIDSGQTMWFRGVDKEAMVVIARSPLGKTSIVLSTIAQIERYLK